MKVDMNSLITGRAVRTVAAICALAVFVGPVLADDGKVTITGGADNTHHQYTWDVTNHSGARIVRIEFPQYGADLFSTPDSWKQGSQKEMNLVNVGWDYKQSGVCWAEPIPPYAGLARGQTARFGMRIAGMGALKSTGTVRVTFDDGTVSEISGVELPTMPTKTSPYLAPLAMGAVLVIFIFVREYRRRKTATAAPSADATEE